jgi:hypothetical protein
MSFMSNPFPGVDPYIEATGLWVGFHNTMIGDCAKLLNAALPSNYAALVDVRVELVDAAAERPRSGRPDVGVVKSLGSDDAGGAAVAVLPEVQTAALTLPDFDAIPEAYIDIISLPDRELITSIELLSPTNKSSLHRGDYIAKRAAMVSRKVNIVEIDLLLDGERLKMKEPLPTADFYVFVSRSYRRPACDVYAWSIRRKLPKIPIPLKVPDADVVLDLGASFAMTYDGGRYNRTLRYDLPLPETLSPSDRDWAMSIAKISAK